MKSVAAITLDLDDTLWPIKPTIHQAEQQVYEWLSKHCPRVTQRYDMEGMRRLRKRTAKRNPSLQHDVTEIRKLALKDMFLSCDYSPRYVDDVYAVFIRARNCVQPFPDVLPALRALHGRFPMVSISNGNADLREIGISAFFVDSVCARSVGAAKPQPRPFLAACETLGLPPHRIVHVGDHPEEDIRGASAVGMKTVWMNRQGSKWNWSHTPDNQISSLFDLLSLIGETECVETNSMYRSTQ